MVVVRDERGCGDTVEREKRGEKDKMSSKWYKLHERGVVLSLLPAGTKLSCGIAKANVYILFCIANNPSMLILKQCQVFQEPKMLSGP